ncbi:MAG TPA: class I SAM-dependent methyltransferase [Stellaceae bacterium]|nr:class I SAM-dependent methyltransferase [Stellaceae bacterium]
MSEFSFYYDKSAISRAVAKGGHRGIIGGLWDEIGRLQLDFLKKMGLDQRSRLVDVGCGCLRGGVHFVDFLDPGNYFGIDMSAELLQAGYDIELNGRGLCDKLPRSNLICNAEFDFSEFATTFDVAIAQSLFTHLPANVIELCLSRLAPHMQPDGVLFATFFIVPDDHPIGAPFTHPRGIRTFDDHDPYHHRLRQIRHLCDGLPWRPELVGEWGHPRDQQMVSLRHSAPDHMAEAPNAKTRALEIERAASLPAGAAHYRAYVGPPDRYDFMSASQFALLFALGLREQQRVLDFGCGSLRLGRLLIPFLRPDRYFGIDPNKWLIEDALVNELGRDILDCKRPTFGFNSDFCCDVFDTKFDYIVAQSILTHCGPDLAGQLLQSMRDALEEGGKAIFTFIKDAVRKPQPFGWTYPNCVSYQGAEMSELCQQAGLCCTEIPWYHPGATWFVAARSPQHLPSPAEHPLLRGAVLFDPQFAASRTLPRPKA